jgi:hypothetical protein
MYLVRAHTEFESITRLSPAQKAAVSLDAKLRFHQIVFLIRRPLEPAVAVL